MNRKMASRKGKMSRKSKNLPGKLMNIPELKQAFEQIEKDTHDLLKQGLDEKETVKKFQDLWRSVFFRSVNYESAKAFLDIKRGSKSSKKGTRKQKQKGGFSQPLAGAPLDYTTRPGVDGPHGSFLQYQTSGLDSYNKFNQIAMDSDPPDAYPTPLVPIAIGSNQA
jgi:hypothetical protein